MNSLLAVLESGRKLRRGRWTMIPFPSDSSGNPVSDHCATWMKRLGQGVSLHPELCCLGFG